MAGYFRNGTRRGLKGWLKHAEARGYIRCGELFVLVVDHESLHRHAMQELDGQPSARDFLCLDRAVTRIEAQLPNEAPAVRARRTVEFELIKTLRRLAPGRAGQKANNAARA